MMLADELYAQVLERVAAGVRGPIALLGLSPAALELAGRLEQAGLGERLAGIFDPRDDAPPDTRPWTLLQRTQPGLLVVCEDAAKEDLLAGAADALDVAPHPQVVLAGMAHQQFRDPVYAELDAPALVPSYATGHPHTRVHLYQCLSAAAANSLEGAIVEFGAFKGGTTAWLARTARRLGLQNSTVIGFDTWDGFPERASLLDLYEHPRCIFGDRNAVEQYLEPLGVELVAGDIAETAPARLDGEPVLLAFADTDNYTGARAGLAAVLPNLVQGGAIVLDHFHTTADYLYTVGERLAARELLEPAGLLHLHGTGVFVKLR